MGEIFMMKTLRGKLGVGATAIVASVLLTAGPAFADSCIVYKSTPSGCTQQTVTGVGGKSGSVTKASTSIPGTALCFSKPPVKSRITIGTVTYTFSTAGNSISGSVSKTGSYSHATAHQWGTTWHAS